MSKLSPMMERYMEVKGQNLKNIDMKESITYKFKNLV